MTDTNRDGHPDLSVDSARDSFSTETFTWLGGPDGFSAERCVRRTR